MSRCGGRTGIGFDSTPLDSCLLLSTYGAQASLVASLVYRLSPVRQSAASGMATPKSLCFKEIMAETLSPSRCQPQWPLRIAGAVE